MSATSTLAAAVLLAGGIAAAVCALALRLSPAAPPPVASVRLEALIAAHLAEAAADETANAPATRAFARALERALAAVAERHRVVLLPRRAIAAGAPDLTEAVEAALAHEQAQAPPEDAPPEDRP